RTLSQPHLALFADDSAPVWIFTQQTTVSDLPAHVSVIQLEELTIVSLLKELAARQVQSLYVEGGAAIHDAFLASGLWQE
ncbi:dihydrofolate reductase family protein, partial [Enterococcus faecalis]|nr:dihydrofolate reductase family protein [Enterococcus faecalis]